MPIFEMTLFEIKGIVFFFNCNHEYLKAFELVMVSCCKYFIFWNIICWQLNPSFSCCFLSFFYFFPKVSECWQLLWHFNFWGRGFAVVGFLGRRLVGKKSLLVNPLIYKWWNLYLLPVALAFMLLCCLDRNQVLMPFCLNSKMADCLVIHMLVLWWHLSKCAFCILVHTLWEISIQPLTEKDVSNFITGTLVRKQKEQREERLS